MTFFFKTQAVRSFLRHQMAALIATFVDFGLMILLTSGFHFPAYGSAATGAIFGAFCNFYLSRFWAFGATTEKAGAQFGRYALISTCSALFNGLGEAALTEGAHVPYVIARLMISVSVSVLWNFPMHRTFVFKMARSTP